MCVRVKKSVGCVVMVVVGGSRGDGAEEGGCLVILKMSLVVLEEVM